MPRARIRFLTPEEGGRAKLPDPAYRYSPIIYANNGWWSLCIDPDYQITPLLTAEVNVRFLSPKFGPHHLLIPGYSFSMYEGPHCVGYGWIIDGTD